MVSLKLETIKEMAERPERRMKSKLPYDNSLNGRFGMKSEPVNYSICNAVRIADTIINNRIVMQIISDKLILLFPQSKLQNTLQNIDTTILWWNMTECSIPVPRYVEKVVHTREPCTAKQVRFTGFNWSESSLLGFWDPAQFKTVLRGRFTTVYQPEILGYNRILAFISISLLALGRIGPRMSGPVSGYGLTRSDWVPSRDSLLQTFRPKDAIPLIPDRQGQFIQMEFFFVSTSKNPVNTYSMFG